MNYKRKFVSVAMAVALSGGFTVGGVIIPTGNAYAASSVAGQVSENNIQASIDLVKNPDEEGYFSAAYKLKWKTVDGSIPQTGWTVTCEPTETLSLLDMEMDPTCRKFPEEQSLMYQQNGDEFEMPVGTNEKKEYVFNITNKDTGETIKVGKFFNETFKPVFEGNVRGSNFVVLRLDGLEPNNIPSGGFDIIDKDGQVLQNVKSGFDNIYVFNMPVKTNTYLFVKNTSTGETNMTPVYTDPSFDVFQRMSADNTATIFDWNMKNGNLLPSQWQLQVKDEDNGGVEVYNETLDGSVTHAEIPLPSGKDYSYTLTNKDTNEYYKSDASIDLSTPSYWNIKDYTVSEDGTSVTVNWDVFPTDDTVDAFSVSSSWVSDASHPSNISNDNYYEHHYVDPALGTYTFNNLDPTAWNKISIGGAVLLGGNNKTFDFDTLSIAPTQGFTANTQEVTDETATIEVNTTNNPSMWLVRNMETNDVQYIDGSKGTLEVANLKPNTAYTLAVSSVDTSETKMVEIVTAAAPEQVIIPLSDIAQPVIADNPGVVDDAVTAPADTATIDYTLDYNQATGAWTLTATAAEGYAFDDEGTTTNVQSGNLDVTPPVVEPTVVSLSDIAQPVIVDKPGSADDSVVVPANTDQITYVLDYDQATGAWTLTATAAEGYVFSDGSTTKVTTGNLDVTPPVVEPTVVPLSDIQQPVIEDKAGSADDSVVVPANTDQITYNLTYNQATGAWTLTATAAEGYVFDGGSTTNVQTGQLDVTPPVVEPTVVSLSDIAQPVIVDKPGSADDAVTAPADTATITYNLTYNKATGAWTLTATAAEGYVFDGGATTNVQTGSVDVSEAPVVEPTVISIADVAKPIVVNKPGSADDSVTAPADTATVDYTLDYNKATGAWTLTATAVDDYVFEGGTKTYTQTGSVDVSEAPVVEPPQPTVININTVAKPVIVDKPGSADDSVTAPADTESINYTLSYDKATGKYVLTAAAKQGFTFEGGVSVFTQSGQLGVSPVVGEPNVVAAAKPVIVDKDGYANDSVTAPVSNARITYDLSYDKKSGKWTLTATAAEGYSFAGGATTVKTSGQLNVSSAPVVNDPTTPAPPVADPTETPIPEVIQTGDVSYGDGENDIVEYSLLSVLMGILGAVGGIFVGKRFSKNS